MAATVLQNVILQQEDVKVEMTPWSMGWRMDVMLAGIKATLISVKALG
jgi:hypothetical protein